MDPPTLICIKYNGDEKPEEKKMVYKYEYLYTFVEYCTEHNSFRLEPAS